VRTVTSVRVVAVAVLARVDWLALLGDFVLVRALRSRVMARPIVVLVFVVRCHVTPGLGRGSGTLTGRLQVKCS
jgi:hypothetical protein